MTAQAQYLRETATIQFTVGTSEQIIAPGIFHKLTGALTSHGLQIRSAQIHTLADGLVLDRFWVRDPDFAGQPPPRPAGGDQAGAWSQSLLRPGLAAALLPPHLAAPAGIGKLARPASATQVNTDNSTSDRYTIIDVFTLDRTGLLYAIAPDAVRDGLSVWRAKIGTYLDQVVDVFYVTDRETQKIQDQARLDAIRRRLLEVVEAMEERGALHAHLDLGGRGVLRPDRLDHLGQETHRPAPGRGRRTAAAARMADRSTLGKRRVGRQTLQEIVPARPAP